MTPNNDNKATTDTSSNKVNPKRRPEIVQRMVTIVTDWQPNPYQKAVKHTSLTIFLLQITYLLANATFPNLVIHGISAYLTDPNLPPEIRPVLSDIIQQLTEWQAQYLAITYTYLAMAALHALGVGPLLWTYYRKPRTWKAVFLHINNVFTVILLPLGTLLTLLYLSAMIFIAKIDRDLRQPTTPKPDKRNFPATQAQTPVHL